MENTDSWRNEEVKEEATPPRSNTRYGMFIFLPLLLIFLGVGAYMAMSRNKAPVNQPAANIPITNTQEVLQSEDETIFTEDFTPTTGIVSPTTAPSTTLTPTITPTKKVSPTITLNQNLKSNQTTTPIPTVGNYAPNP